VPVKEATAALADPAAEKVLVEVATADGDDEDVRKAAWKAVRRSKRARTAS
jgi:ParB family chromosome partitioning protein